MTTTTIDPLTVLNKAPNLILRPIPEWGCLFIYTPTQPDIHCLDARSWLLFELCDGRPFSEVLKEFSDAVPEGTAEHEVLASATDALSTLLEKAVIRQESA